MGLVAGGITSFRHLWIYFICYKSFFLLLFIFLWHLLITVFLYKTINYFHIPYIINKKSIRVRILILHIMPSLSWHLRYILIAPTKSFIEFYKEQTKMFCCLLKDTYESHHKILFWISIIGQKGLQIFSSLW